MQFTAISTVVTIAEILKNNGLAVEKSEIIIHYAIIHISSSNKEYHTHLLSEICCAEIMTSTVDMKDESRGRPIQKAKVSLNAC